MEANLCYVRSYLISIVEFEANLSYMRAYLSQFPFPNPSNCKSA